MSAIEALEGGDVVRMGDVMIAMRDRVRLATDIYLPARDGKPISARMPVLLERTPYDKRGRRAAEISVADRSPMTQQTLAARLVRAGYAVAMQDCRGRHRSEGTFAKYLGEAEDGFDTIAWLAAQSWCDGRVGTFGLSYCAHVQTAAACLSPPALAGMLLDSGGFSNAFQGGIRQGGAFELKQATWAFNHAKESPCAKADARIASALAAQDIHAWFRRMPWSEGTSPIAAVPEYESYLLEQWRGECFTPAWQIPALYAQGFVDRIPDVPILLMSSWYDPYPRTVTENYLALRNAPGRTAPLWLVLGPWLHGRRSDSWSGDIEFGPDATLDGALARDYTDFRIRFFDAILGRVEKTPSEPRVRYFRMGGGPGTRNANDRLVHGGNWIAANDWPPPGTRIAPYYLHADGTLSTAPPTSPQTLAYDFDPANPVPSIGGTITSGAPVMEGGAFDQHESERFFGCSSPGRPLADRADVMVFETAPLTQDIEITGPVTARLCVSASTPDTDLTIKLIDHYPPSAEFPEGFAMNVTDGIQRLKFHSGYAEPRLLEPGRIYEVEVHAFPTSNLFKAGHRIRLDVSSSNFPHFDVNPNTGAPAGIPGARQVARISLYMGPQHQSAVLLPTVKGAEPLTLAGRRPEKEAT